MHITFVLLFLGLAAAAGFACSSSSSSSPTPSPSSGSGDSAMDTADTMDTMDTSAVDGALPPLDGERILTDTRELSSGIYQGRLPGTEGGARAVAWIEEQFKTIGLAPGNPDGTYVQAVPLVSITPSPDATLTFRCGGETRQLRYREDFVASTPRVEPRAGLDDSPLLFAGYGVVAPEYEWDDFKGASLKGKTLVVLVNDPQIPDPNDPSRLDPKMFGGKAMTYYGRWTYKYEIAAKLGAEGVLIVHETGPAGYPFSVLQSGAGEAFQVEASGASSGQNALAVQGWITRPEAEKLFAMAGKNFDELKRAALRRDFRPVPLGVTASITLRNRICKVASRNVLGKIEGSDPRLKHQYVIYTAHWDHLGAKPSATHPGETDIYYGALDNASGVAGMLEMARAWQSLPVKPKRSILFLAVTAEEQGLLGSGYYATHPLYPLRDTAAEINIDTLNVWGRTKDLTIVGLGQSELDDYAARAAAAQGRVLRPDPEPEKGFYYRSDHFSFAKAGVPALDPEWGIDYLDHPEGWGIEVHDAFNTQHYHQPSDQVRPGWDMSGAVEDLELLMRAGYGVAQARDLPRWKPGSEFRATRERQTES